MINKDTLYGFLNNRAEHPLSFRDISEHLGLASSERRVLKRLLRSLVEDGLIIRNRKGLYGTLKELEFVVGYFEAHREGYGFVILEQPGKRDVFVPSRSTMGAMDDDKVIVRIESKKRREGSIVRIIDRAHRKVFGILDRNRAGYFIRPKDPKISFDLYVSPADTGGAAEGDMVSAEIKEYPLAKGPASARVVKVIKKPVNPASEIDSIIEEMDLPTRFSSKALLEAKELEESSRLRSFNPDHARRDLRDLRTVTIDGERARDFDDAVSIERTEGGFRLWVHIADVAHYVKWNSPIDIEARRRGNSFYFPDRVIPMLPKELSEDLCSLRPQLDRLTMTVEMDFNNQGIITGASFYPSIIRSSERMTYTAVRQILVDKDPAQTDRYFRLIEDFVIMADLQESLKAQRRQRGSLDFDLPEPDVLIDALGNPENIIRAERNVAHSIIEEFMIAANEAAARFFEDREADCIYRVHEMPEQDRLIETFRFLHSSGLIKEPVDGRIRDLHNFILNISGHPLEDLITKHVLRSLKQARYSTVNIGHFGLASQAYAHFTSPIRRYPDLVVHRLMRHMLGLEGYKPLAKDNEFEELLSDISFSSSRMERKADDAERNALNSLRVWFMKDKEGESFKGQVIHVLPYGLKVRLYDYYVEGFLHVSYMIDDFYRYDEMRLRLTGAHRKRVFSIGSDIIVRVESLDFEGREVLFGIAD